VRVELEAEPTEPVVAAAMAVATVTSAAPDGRALVAAIEAEAAVPDVVAAVVAAGGRVRGVALERDRLEDVYLRLVEG
jgi:hypothetical protein